MADYYTQFSFMLPCDKDMAQRVHDAFFEDEDEDDDTWYETHGGIRVEVEDGGLWVSDDGDGGNPEAAFAITQLYLIMAGKPEHGVIITWANTCSKPRLGAFSGGLALVTVNDIEVAIARQEIEREAGQAGIELIETE